MSKYKELFKERYRKENPTYKEKADYLFMIGAPEEYIVEDEMLEYLINNPDATLDEVYEYFDKIAPEGLPPGDDGSDLLDDDDDMSEYTKLLEERYKKEHPTYHEEDGLIFMLNAPRDYLVEDEMLVYLKENPDASLDDVINYFDNIAPEGLPPGDDGSDLLDDDDE